MRQGEARRRRVAFKGAVGTKDERYAFVTLGCYRAITGKNIRGALNDQNDTAVRQLRIRYSGGPVRTQVPDSYSRVFASCRGQPPCHNDTQHFAYRVQRCCYPAAHTGHKMLAYPCRCARARGHSGLVGRRHSRMRIRADAVFQ